jgi:hypothetical protein
VWAGVDSAWEQEKPEARKLLENAQIPTRLVQAHVGLSFLAVLFYRQLSYLFVLIIHQYCII